MILKFIAISLLVLLGIFLILLLLLLVLLVVLLFIPIRYQMKVEYGEGKFSFYGDISFLLRMLRAKIIFDQKLSYRVKALFFTIFSDEKKKREKKESKKESKKEKKKVGEEEKEKKKMSREEKEKKTEVLETREKIFVKKIEEEKQAEKQDKIKIEEERKKTENEKVMDEKEKIDFFEKVEEKWEKVVEFGDGVFEKVENAHKSYEETMKKKDIVLKFWNSTGTVEGIGLLFSQSIRLIRAILPRKIEGRVRFGTGDVYTEGQYLTYLCLIYGLYADKLVIEPEWEEEVLEVDLYLKGRIRLFTILRICIKVYFNENFRKLRDSFDFMRARLGF